MATPAEMDITFSQVLSIGSQISFKLGTTLVKHAVVSSRTMAGQITYSPVLANFIKNYQTALILDNNTILTPTLTGVSTLNLKSNNLVDFFTEGGTTPENTGVVFTYKNANAIPTIEGLSSNNYYINNPIMIGLKSTALGGYFIVRFTDNTTGITTSNFIAQQDPTGRAVLDISGVIKSIFSYPKCESMYDIAPVPHNGCDNVTIRAYHSSYTSTAAVLTKNFLRGGNRTQNTNQAAGATGIFLQTGNVVPVWSGYPVDATYFNTDGKLYHYSLNNIPSTIIDNRRVKGCSSVYMRFLNQRGGYSYWLFETGEETETNTPLGGFIKFGYLNRPSALPSGNVPKTGVVDLGNEVDTKFAAIGKVPKQYIDLIRDLIVSPEVYYLNEFNDFVRVILNKNTIVEDANKRAFSVKISFDLYNRFNPSLLWSNY